MTEAEGVRVEEPDVAEDDVPFPDVVAAANTLSELRRAVARLEESEEKQKEKVLRLMQGVTRLHGIRLKNGDAVRLTWSVRTTAKPEPARLRELMADAGNYISEVVDLPNLRKDYPSIWEKVGKVKRTQTVNVRLAGDR